MEGRIRDLSEDGNYNWEDMKAVNDDSYDYVAVFNSTNSKIDYRRAILFHCEPSYISTEFFRNNHPYMFRYDVGKYHAVCFNFIKTPYRDLLNHSPTKTKDLSAVISHLYSQDNHVRRRDFLLNYLYKNFPQMDHYGKGFTLTGNNCYKGLVTHKEDALFPYKYSFAGESVIEDGYFTEKIIDCILCETLCFYSGCNNIKKFIPFDSYIPIDISKPEEAVEVIKNSINGNEYEKRLDSIKECKKYVIKELNPFNIVRKIVNKQIT